jgi:Xaa-Pro aminopeptidase
MNEQRMDRKDYIPQLSIPERDRRWRAVREEMVLHGVDCLLVWGTDYRAGMCQANLRYLVHDAFFSTGGICVFPLQGTPIVFMLEKSPGMVTRPFPLFQAFQSWIPEPENIRPWFGLMGVIDLLKELGYEKGTIGLVDAHRVWRVISYENYNTLLRELPKAKVVEATGIIDRVRVIKSQEEIQFLRRACEIARLKIDALVAASIIGAKECEVYAEMVRADIANGGEPYIFNFLTSGSVTEPYKQHLLHGKLPPLAPTTRKLQEGDLIVTEFHTNYGGYLAAAETSVFIGKPPERLRQIWDMAVNCVKSGTDKMKPGVRVEEAWQAFYKPLQGTSMVPFSMGFSAHALSSGDFPSSMHPPKTAAEQCTATLELRENMTLCTVADIYDPNWRDDVGIMFGDTVLITKDGAQTLVNVPLEFPCKE